VRAKQELARPRIIVFAALAGVLLTLPALRTGIYLDDYDLRFAAKGFPGLPDVGGSRLDCFSFADGNLEHNRVRIDWGLLPWWAVPDANLSFCRRLSALTHFIDFEYLEPAWWVMHLESLLWYAALCAAAALLYRRIIPVPWVAGLAAMFYAIDDAHGIPAGWLSNRNAVLYTFFGVLVLLAHDAWRRRGWRPGPWWAMAALAAGLASGEGAVSVGGYLLAYALFLDPAPRLKRAWSLVPYGVVAVAYAVYYSSQGYGTRGSGLYIDPIREPLAFISAVARHVPILLHGQLGLVPANIYVLLSPFGRLMHSAAGVLVLGVFLVIIFPLLRSDRVARFWALGMVLSALPSSSTAPSERLLCYTGLGAMALVAQFIHRVAESKPIEQSRRAKVERVTAGFLLVAHGLVAPLSMPFACTSATIFGNAVERGLSVFPDGPEIAERTIVMLNAPFDVFGANLPLLRAARGQTLPRHIWVLSVGLGVTEVSRRDAHTLDIQTEGGFFPFPYGTTFRGPQAPFHAGDRFTVSDFTAEVLAVTDDHRPGLVRFRFETPLEDPARLWYCLGDRAMTPCTPPKIGESMQLPAMKPVQWLLGSWLELLFPARVQ